MARYLPDPHRTRDQSAPTETPREETPDQGITEWVGMTWSISALGIGIRV